MGNSDLGLVTPLSAWLQQRACCKPFPSSAYVPSPAIHVAARGFKRQQNQTSSQFPTAEGHLGVKLDPWGARFGSQTWEQPAGPSQSCQINMYHWLPFSDALCQERSISTSDKPLTPVLQGCVLQWPLWVHRNSQVLQRVRA